MVQKFNNNSAVFGAVERNGFVKTNHVKSTGARVLLPLIEAKVAKVALINSGEWRAYTNLKRRGYSQLEYVQGTSHTNTIEGYWSQLKRALDGTYPQYRPSTYRVVYTILRSAITSGAFRFALFFWNGLRRFLN